jgi:ABC-type transporter Mla subunit MlaD
MLRFRSSLLCLCVCALSLATGCKTAYYKTWEKLGWEKRDILVDRVKDARDDQDAAKKQFQTTLDQFKAVTGYNGGDLEAKYKKLNSAYDAAEARANDVRNRIKSVESVAADMFKEWNSELSEYQNADLRRSSEQKLNQTKDRYNQLISVMKQASSKMDPVLAAFHDQVLYLKHNLNADAISSLQQTATGINTDVENLIRDMNASIAEANSFINDMNKASASKT